MLAKSNQLALCFIFTRVLAGGAGKTDDADERQVGASEGIDAGAPRYTLGRLDPMMADNPLLAAAIESGQLPAGFTLPTKSTDGARQEGSHTQKQAKQAAESGDIDAMVAAVRSEVGDLSEGKAEKGGSSGRPRHTTASPSSSDGHRPRSHLPEGEEEESGPRSSTASPSPKDHQPRPKASNHSHPPEGGEHGSQPPRPTTASPTPRSGHQPRSTAADPGKLPEGEEEEDGEGSEPEPHGKGKGPRPSPAPPPPKGGHGRGRSPEGKEGGKEGGEGQVPRPSPAPPPPKGGQGHGRSHGVEDGDLPEGEEEDVEEEEADKEEVEEEDEVEEKEVEEEDVEEEHVEKEEVEEEDEVEEKEVEEEEESERLGPRPSVAPAGPGRHPSPLLGLLGAAAKKVAEGEGGGGHREGKLDAGVDSPGAPFGSHVPWPQWPPDPPEPHDIFLRGEDLNFGALPMPSLPDWPLALPEPPDLDDGRHQKVEEILADAAVLRMRERRRRERRRQELEDLEPGGWEQEPIDVKHISQTLLCSQQDIVWEPLDMVPFSNEDNVSACQARCARTSGCAHFSYWLPGNDCHLQNAFSHPTIHRLGFVSGPPGCKANQMSKELVTIILKKKVCFDEDAEYMLLDTGGMMPMFVPTVLECQRDCAAHPESTHFSYNSLTKLCHCESPKSTEVSHMAFYVAGPTRCQPVIFFSMVLDGVNWVELQGNGGSLFSFEMAIARAVAAETGPDITTDHIGVVIAGKTPKVEVLLSPPNHLDSAMVLERLHAATLVEGVEREVNGIQHGNFRTAIVQVRSVSKFVLEEDNRLIAKKYADQRGHPQNFLRFGDAARLAAGALLALGALSTVALFTCRAVGRAKASRRTGWRPAAAQPRRPGGLLESVCTEERDTRDVEVVVAAERPRRSSAAKFRATSRLLAADSDHEDAGSAEPDQSKHIAVRSERARDTQGWLRLSNA